MSQVLVSQLRGSEPLTDGRIHQTFDVLGHAGLVIHWYGWAHGDGELSKDTQFFETSDGRRFDPEQQDDAVRAWVSLQPPAEVALAPVKPVATYSADAEIKSRRFVTRSVIPSRLKALDDAHLPYKQISDGHYLVYGSIEYYPATGFWRAQKCDAHGYTIDTLIAQARRQDQRKLAVVPTAYEAPAIGPVGDEAPLSTSPDTTMAEPHATHPASGTETADVTSKGGEQPDVTAVAFIECGSRALLPPVTP